MARVSETERLVCTLVSIGALGMLALFAFAGGQSVALTCAALAVCEIGCLLVYLIRVALEMLDALEEQRDLLRANQKEKSIQATVL